MANLNGGSGSDLIIGTIGNDNINGMGGSDTLFGDAGVDNIDGDAGDDFLDGGVGNDDLEGGTGNDTLLGGSDDDKLDGGANDDYLDGGSGNNRIWGGTGMDTLLAGSGNDRLDGGADNDHLDAGSGNNELWGGTGNDTLLAASGNDVLNGGANDDYLDAGSGINDLFGDTGNDTLLAGSGNDVLNGGADNDVLDGGGGNDVLSGATGDDEFLFKQSDNLGATDNYDGGAGIDTLHLDLTLAERLNPALQLDLINFSQFLTANTLSNGQANNAEFHFTAFDLTVTQIEVYVDGGVPPPKPADSIVYGGAGGAYILSVAPDGTLTDTGIQLSNGGQQGYGVAVADVDGDGHEDVLVTGDNAFGRLHYNNGNGTFSDSGQLFPGQFQTFVSAGDIDNDNDLDVYFSNTNGEQDPVPEQWRHFHADFHV